MNETHEQRTERLQNIAVILNLSDLSPQQKWYLLQTIGSYCRREYMQIEQALKNWEAGDSYDKMMSWKNAAHELSNKCEELLKSLNQE